MYAHKNSAQKKPHTNTFLVSVSALCFAVLLSGTVCAGQVYRCGNTFSSEPCGADAEEQTIFGADAESTKNLDEKSAAVCLENAINGGLLGNPGGAQVQAVTTRKSRIVDFKGRSLMGFHMRVAISEMNAMTGAYNPPRHFDCVLTPDLSRVFSVAPMGGAAATQ